MLDLATSVALVAAASAQAPTQEANSNAVADQAVKPATIAANQPDESAASRPKLWFQVGIEPRIESDSPFTTDRDSTVVSWILGMEYVLGRGWTLKASAGPSAVVDSDRDAKARSTFDFGAELLSNRPILLGFTPSLSYGVTRNFTAFFEDGVSWEHTFATTLTRSRKFTRGSLDFALSARRIESTAAASDYSALRVNPTLTLFPFGEDRMKIVIDSTAERQRYDGIDASIGARRWDWVFVGVLGFDFAPWINARLNPYVNPLPNGSRPANIVNRFQLGVRVSNTSSNVDANDKTALRFAPVLRLRIGF